MADQAPTILAQKLRRGVRSARDPLVQDPSAPSERNQARMLFRFLLGRAAAAGATAQMSQTLLKAVAGLDDGPPQAAYSDIYALVEDVEASLAAGGMQSESKAFSVLGQAMHELDDKCVDLPALTPGMSDAGASAALAALDEGRRA